MKRIVNYKTFINESSSENNLTPEQIDFLNNYVKGKWKLNADGFVDVDGNVHCSDKEISDFKGIVFGKVIGDFDFSYNNFTSLEGCPKEVGGDFDCSNNRLTSLEFGPERVNGDFDCTDNSLTSLEFGPKEVGGTFDCSRNNLTSLEGAPEKLNGVFYFSCNNLTTLEGAPKKLGSQFFCEDNEGLSTETINLIFDKMETSKSDYKTVLKSLWEKIPIEDKVLLYKTDLDWVEEDEAAKLSKLKKYSNIKKII